VAKNGMGKRPLHRHKFTVRGGESQPAKRLGHGFGVWVDWGCREPGCGEVTQKWERRNPPK
jgi:hypothetical protein